MGKYSLTHYNGYSLRRATFNQTLRIHDLLSRCQRLVHLIIQALATR